MRIPTLTAAAFAAAIAVPAAAQDAYVVGITAALTGPPASTYAPAMDALRIYIDRVNANGGVNGKQIKLVFLDDSAEPSKAAANMKRLLSQDQAILLVNASLSSTYGPVVAESKRANVPLLFASGVCPKESYPPADPLQFCTTAYASTFDSRGALTFIKENAKDKVKLGLAAMAIPLSRGEMEFAQKQAPEFGFEVVGPRGDPASDAGLHAVCDQAQGRGRDLDVFLGALGDAGAHARSVAEARLEGRLHHLGAS